MIRNACLIALASIGLVSASPLSAQTALGTLRGVVLDQQSGALPGATVTARQLETNTTQAAVTGAEGQFFLPNLRPGKYEVTSDLQGFAGTRQTSNSARTVA